MTSRGSVARWSLFSWDRPSCCTPASRTCNEEPQSTFHSKDPRLSMSMAQILKNKVRVDSRLDVQQNLCPSPVECGLHLPSWRRSLRKQLQSLLFEYSVACPRFMGSTDTGNPSRAAGSNRPRRPTVSRFLPRTYGRRSWP